MSFLLILIKFFLSRNVVDVLFQWLYLEKQKYYLLLVWAMQSMFHVVANRNSAPWAVSSCPARGWWDVWGEAWPPGVRGGPVSPCLHQSPSIIVAATGRWRWCVLPGRECRAWNHCCPAEPKLATMSFLSMSFCLLGICTTHVVSLRFIYL